MALPVKLVNVPPFFPRQKKKKRAVVSSKLARKPTGKARGLRTIQGASIYASTHPTKRRAPRRSEKKGTRDFTCGGPTSSFSVLLSPPSTNTSSDEGLAIDVL